MITHTPTVPMDLHNCLLEHVVGAGRHSRRLLQGPGRSLIEILQLVVVIVQLGRHVTQYAVHLMREGREGRDKMEGRKGGTRWRGGREGGREGGKGRTRRSHSR